MKGPFESSDPLLKAVVQDNEAGCLNAAAEVRSRLRRRRKIVQGALLVALLVGAGLIVSLHEHWTSHPNLSPVANDTANPGGNGQAPHSVIAAKTAFVREYSTDSRIDDSLGDSASTAEERKLLSELNDQPALIVWNDAGQVSRVHIFEASP